MWPAASPSYLHAISTMIEYTWTLSQNSSILSILPLSHTWLQYWKNEPMTTLCATLLWLGQCLHEILPSSLISAYNHFIKNIALWCSCPWLHSNGFPGSLKRNAGNKERDGKRNMKPRQVSSSRFKLYLGCDRLWGETTLSKVWEVTPWLLCSSSAASSPPPCSVGSLLDSSNIEWYVFYHGREGWVVSHQIDFTTNRF